MNLPKVMHASWHIHVRHLFEDEKMKMIKEDILANCSFYPEAKDIFRVFSMPLENIKVVILGQDPYPNGEAIGLAFAVNSKSKIPASLKVIAKEIERCGLKSGFYDSDIIHWKTLESWHEQGVFLFNTALTVKAQNAGSHLGIWQWFTKEIVSIISKNTPCIWMLWGAKAQSFKNCIDNKDNHILEAPHPAAELYSAKTNKTFTGCNHFITCNEILKLKNNKQINF